MSCPEILLPTPTSPRNKKTSFPQQKHKNRVLFRVRVLLETSRSVPQKVFTINRARAATSQPFSFRGTSLLERWEGVVVTQVKIVCPSVYFYQTLNQKVVSKKIEVIVGELSRRGRNGPVDLRREIIIDIDTWRKRPPSTTPNLRIEKDEEVTAKMRCIASAAKTRLIKWKKIHRYSMAHTDQNHTKQTIIKNKKKGFT